MVKEEEDCELGKYRDPHGGRDRGELEEVMELDFT